MSTNYYWRHNICTCCGRYDEWHICKSLISFQGHFGPSEWDEANQRYTTPPALATTWAEWKGLLRSDGEVWDEYDVQHDVEQFITDVEATSPEGRRRQYDWLDARRYGEFRYEKYLDRVEPGCDWLDPDGFSFHGGEFS